jgi:hypothetical protein
VTLFEFLASKGVLEKQSVSTLLTT